MLGAHRLKLRHGGKLDIAGVIFSDILNNAVNESVARGRFLRVTGVTEHKEEKLCRVAL